MRIIDNKHDFYDYLQDSTDTIVFDRRNSYMLSKTDISRHFDFVRYDRKAKYRFLLIQAGVTYWLFLIRIEDFYIIPICTWKNYNKPNRLIALDIITFRLSYYLKDNDDYSLDKIKRNTDKLISAIDNNEISTVNVITYPHYNQIPIFASCGFGSYIDATEMFCAIEEYFSIEKTKSETTVAKGTTDKDKITTHGFDVKTSFRSNKK